MTEAAHDTVDQLARRVDALGRRYLPLQFSETGEYAPELQDDFRAFRVLAHAEVEHCLETLSKQAAEQAVVQWRRDQVPTRVVVTLLLAYVPLQLYDLWDAQASPRIGRPLVVSSSGATPTADAVVAAGLREHLKVINDNHGLQSQYVTRLFQPVGLRRRDFDESWLADLDSFGALRGSSAHTSAIVAKSINPKDEMDRVQRVIAGVRELQRAVRRVVPGH
ncbi:MAG: hypothetical protein CVU47_09995 [Chloroflexi bacterium HGW-Chloroflexi-9]|nr:MAG: hypothetical protein CVU47_09995 [Chloroflexi bacterium HGW-Chloroflexi-9]